MFSNIKTLELVKKFSTVEVNDIQDAKLRTQAKKLKAKQGGFTLLELLVVVAILAAIAGTATIALQDTDSRASAAAHVAMMDELNKGIRTFRVLNRTNGKVYPNNMDSLIQVSTAPVAGTVLDTPVRLSVTAITDVGIVPLSADLVTKLNDVTITGLQYVVNNVSEDPDEDGDCSDIAGLIGSRGNAVVAGNIFLTPDGNGCGAARTLESGDSVAIWTGGQERLIGQPAATGVTEYDGSNLATATGLAFMATGLGPASDLFNANALGGLTSVPVYRHVSNTEYNRFIAIWNIGTFNGSGVITPADQVTLTSIVDGAGDTKEEELGEWDGTRNTI